MPAISVITPAPISGCRTIISPRTPTSAPDSSVDQKPPPLPILNSDAITPMMPRISAIQPMNSTVTAVAITTSPRMITPPMISRMPQMMSQPVRRRWIENCVMRPI